ncbi:sigma-70 family RNA polymerase sigma factor [Paenibacillus xylanexedens]|uniref:sigma-70 family RNA polymerase sigma factor n=1 Tax=Paenibacillus xylanexedens TaxID=528191 RepID=UPI0011A51951|nr:sigma-70 family RNA polymerase sigma factor [Paenibacillus xylanexedens]
MEIQAQAQALSFDELFALGEVDEILRKSEEKVKIKTQHMRFAGIGKDDVVQEALIKVYTALNSYDSSKSRVSTFLDHVIDNSIRDTLRKVGSERNLRTVNALSLSTNGTVENMDPQEVGLLASELSAGTRLAVVEPGYGTFEIMEDIMHNLDLTDRQKEVIRLYTSGYSLKEIAEIFHVSRSRMSQIWSRIVAKCAVAM